MSLEQDIRQAKFRNEHHKASINIIYTYNWVMERQKALFDAENITPQQFNILRILRGSAPRPISTLQIRERMLDRMSDTSRIVDRLIIKELVKKSVSREDRRLVDVQLTDKGKKLLQQMDSLNVEMDAVFRNLSPEEAGKLNELLDKIRSEEEEA